MKASRLIRLKGALLVALLFAARPGFTGEKISNWRLFNAADGLRESKSTAVTISQSITSRGRIWVTHGDAGWMTRFNGWQTTNFPTLDTAASRIYEGKSGQTWTIYWGGLQEFSQGRWISYPIPEVEKEFRANAALRPARPLSLWPIEHNRVLLLLPDRLLEFNANLNQTVVWRLASQTRLGKFSEMVSSRDDGLWIAGAGGLAKIPGPIRLSKSDSKWQEFIIDEESGVQNLQRPFEDALGGVCAVAESLLENKRVVVYLEGDRWSVQIPRENIRQAWRGADGVFWGTTISSLFSWEKDEPLKPVKDEVAAGQFFDVAVEPNASCFWLATSEGVFRYAPLLWQTPRSLDSIHALVHSVLEDAQGRLWFAGADSLTMLESNQWKSFPLPSDLERRIESSAQSPGAIFTLNNGSIIMSAGDRLLQFSPTHEAFSYVSHPSSGPVRPVGNFKDGNLCVQVLSAEGPRGAYRLEIFDGEKFQPFSDFNFGTELHCLLAAQNGDLWLAGNGGVAVRHENDWQVFPAAESGAPDGASCLLEMNDRKIWCGGRGKIWEFDGKKWTVVRTGFNQIRSLMKSRDGSVWVGSESGITRFYKEVWVDYGIEEGLHSGNTYDLCEDRNGRVWAGTLFGLSLFHPEADADPPRVIAIDRRGAPEATSLQMIIRALDKWKNTPASRLLYSYRLDEQEWTPFNSENVISFSELSAGNHQFKVRVMDRNWNLDVAPVYEFVVALPWYRETRLLLISGFAMAAIVFLAAFAFNRHRQLLRSYAQVEKIVALRTEQLGKANSELLQSQKMTALGTLAAGVAHDFNNILSIIKGSAQIIEGNLNDPEKIRTRLDRIKTVVDQGSGIVKAMLGFSRSSDRQLASCDINSLVDETTKLLGDRFLREIEIQFEWAPALPAVPAAKDLIQQILLNLIFNAADALSGSGQIILRSGQMKSPPANPVLPPVPANEYVFISVIDTGCGIAPEILPRIFEPFFTTKAFSTRRGTGLGLSMAYELAKEMGYGINVQSVLGKGSAFTLIIPVKTVPATAEATAKA